MKKTVVILLVLLMGMTFGCGKKPYEQPADTAPPAAEGTDAAAETAAPKPTEAPEEDSGVFYCRDYRRGVEAAGFANALIETENEFYFLRADSETSKSFIYFSDKDYKDWMPLCPKPNCLHNDEDCDAFIETSCGIALYSKYIWYVDPKLDESGSMTQPMLCRLRLDGTRHEEVMPLPAPETEIVSNDKAWSCSFTNKYLVVSYAAYRTTASGNVIESEYAPYVLDLETLKYKLITTDTVNGEPNCIGTALQGEGPVLYTLNTDFSERKRWLNRLDCEAGVNEFVGEVPFELYIGEGGMLFADGYFYYEVWHTSSDNSVELMRMDLSTGESVSVAVEERPYAVGWAHGDWTNKLFFSTLKSDLLSEEERGFRFYNTELELIYSCGFGASAPEGSDRIAIAYQTESCVFGIMTENGNMTPTSDPPVWYFEKADIGTDGLMWKRWE